MSETDTLIDLLRLFNIEVDRFIEVFTRAHGLHRTDLNAVAYIWRAAEEGRPLTPGELARKLRLSPAATTALLGRLERAGHVERCHDTEDRRRVHLKMQPPARDLALAFFTPLGRHMRAAFAELDDEELAVAAKVMRRVLSATTAAADEASPHSTVTPPDSAVSSPHSAVSSPHSAVASPPMAASDRVAPQTPVEVPRSNLQTP